ncbi:hypothetical protein M408DRAFT_26468, partial [Serendipita vermifera MAFF 305830]
MPDFTVVTRPFKRQKISHGEGGPNASGQATPVPEAADIPSSDEPTPNAPTELLDIESSISKATDLRDPLKATTEALKK